MKEYVLENLNDCCDMFQALLLSDQYLSNKDLEQFLAKYNESFLLLNKGYIDSNDLLYRKVKSIVNSGYNIIAERNEVYIKRKLNELSTYFDDMFKDEDKSIILDNEQRKSIVSDEDYSLIVAPPGTGKTTLAIAKIKYLIDQKQVNPNTIIFVCPTKKKSKEVKDIIKDIFKVNIDVLTITDLALNLIGETYRDNYNISNYNNMNNLIFAYIINTIFPDKEKLKLFISAFNHKVSLKDDYMNYKTYNEYYDAYISSQYEIYKNNIDRFIINKINSFQKQYKSLNGDTLRSFEEVEIANYLYINNIDYEYYAKENIDDYVADFIINLNGKNLYIEYYGLTSLKSDGTYLIQDTNLRRNLKVKQAALRKKYGDNLIELYNNIDYIKTLEQELDKRNIKKRPLSKKSIFTSLMMLDKGIELKGVTNLISRFIKKFKENGYKLEDFDMLIRRQYKDNLKKELIFIRDIYEFYESYLENNNMIDVNDLIYRATNSLDKLKHDNKYRKISYLIMDDYQSMSSNHSYFAKHLSDLFDAKIVALGDDWESLYALGQSDLDVFRDFYNIMGYANIMRISTSYRSSQEIIDIASNYIGKDLSSYSKSIISSTHMDKPVEINYYSKDNIYEKFLALDYAITKIYRDNKDSRILILSPFKDAINEYVENGYFKKGQDGLLVYQSNPKVHIEFHTVLETKGLEYDQVILLAGRRCYSFNDDDELLKLFDNVKTELIDNPEDRRLFYIAMTRTKNKLYIISPMSNVLPHNTKIAI